MEYDKQYSVWYEFYDIFTKMLQFGSIKYYSEYDPTDCNYIFTIYATDDQHNFIQKFKNKMEEHYII